MFGPYWWDNRRMGTDLPPWPPLPGDELVLRSPPITFDLAGRWWPAVVFCAVFDVPLVALLIAKGTTRDWLYGAMLMVLWNGFHLAVAWGYQRRFVRFEGWKVTVCPGWGLTKAVDLRWVVHARLQQHGSGQHCRLRLIPVKGYPRSIAVPLDPPELREALLSRLALVPTIAASGKLRTELTSRR